MNALTYSRLDPEKFVVLCCFPVSGGVEEIRSFSSREDAFNEAADSVQIDCACAAEIYKAGIKIASLRSKEDEERESDLEFDPECFACEKDERGICDACFAIRVQEGSFLP